MITSKLQRAIKVALLFLSFAGLPAMANAVTSETIVVDSKAPGKPFIHMWEHMFGSGRAILSLRESYRNDLRKTKTVADVKYIRFHNIFHDEVGVYDEDKDGKPIYNFTYVDQIYDGLLDLGVRPFVELSFMPAKLSNTPPEVHEFWYKPLVGPPKDWQKWGDLNYQFVKHLVERYGIDEVSQWYFEVWNEPDLDFWKGEPKKETYFKLYDTAVQAIKRCDKRLRVGGPSTATQEWMADFIEHCVKENVPMDFVSTHNYANESDEKAYKEKPAPRSDVTANNVKKIYDIVKASKRPDVPIIWSEYNASWMNEVNVTDSPFMGPWLANNIRQCDGLASGMSLWTFSDVFEESGPAKTPFYGGFGLIAPGGIPKASFNALKLLHKLGDVRLPVESNSVIATRDKQGDLKLALWNYGPAEKPGTTKDFTVRFNGVPNSNKARIHIVDKDHGSALTAWERMGKPQFPTRQQQAELMKAAELSEPQTLPLDQNSELKMTLAPQTLVLIEIVP
ncbi:MAG: hypothetical protein K2X77_25725 [Candidatus Obscuribacterales bacterium]|jgi:xylan 1,4-beta-xylosidase|nr:hypothetical protein [Candidatus Obscuribacterales bacterium]